MNRSIVKNIISHKSNRFNFLSSIENKKVIIFDFDGTLVDTKESAMKAYYDIFMFYYGSYENFPKILKCKNAFESFLGMPFVKSLKNKLGFNDEESEKLYKIYFEMRKKYVHLDKLYPNVIKTLEQLCKQGKTLCIATQKREEPVNYYLEKFNLKQYFTHIICRNEKNQATSNKEQIIIEALEQLKVSPNECIMIGDMIDDYTGAKNNKMSFVGIIDGYGDFQTLICIYKYLFNSIIHAIKILINIMCSREKYFLSGFT